MTSTKLHKALSTPNEDAVLLSVPMFFQPRYTIQDRELQLEEHGSQKTY